MGKIFDWMYFSYLEMKHAKAKARGKTVRHETDWLGRKKKIVEDHYRGTRKTYSYGHGFFGDVTKTETTRGGRLVEVGEVKRPLFTNNRTEVSKRSDGTNVSKRYEKSFFSNDILTKKQSGICFKCKGLKEITLSCKLCFGSGLFTMNERQCFSCEGNGKIKGSLCTKCKGTGVFKPEKTVPCKRCAGMGNFNVICKRCNGTGTFDRVSYRSLDK